MEGQNEAAAVHGQHQPEASGGSNENNSGAGASNEMAHTDAQPSNSTEVSNQAMGATADANPSAPAQDQQPLHSQQQPHQEQQQEAASTQLFNAQDGLHSFQPQETTAFPTDMNGTFPGLGMMAQGDVQSVPMMPMNGNHLQTQAANGDGISADEIALYDRQIRLWGMKAQKKIQGANILIITIKALANEIAKNLALAGVGSLTLVDDQPVTEADLGSQFFLSQENVGQNRGQAACEQIRKLNPRVKVFADTESIMTKGPSYFSVFDIVIATDMSPTSLAFINTATRLYDRKFYAIGCHGLYGYIFCDLVEHDFVLTRDKSNVASKVGSETRTRSITEIKEEKEGSKITELIAKRDLYSTWDLASETSALPAEYIQSKRRLKAVTPALSCLRALWGFESMYGRLPGHNKQDLEFFTRSATAAHQMLSLPAETLNAEFLRSFLQNIGSEISPVAAILGGQLAQDVINVLGQSQQPIQNLVIFDGNKMEANLYPMHPEGNLGKAQLEIANPMPIMPMPNAGDQQQMMPLDQTMGHVPPPLDQNGQMGAAMPPAAPAADQQAQPGNEAGAPAAANPSAPTTTDHNQAAEAPPSQDNISNNNENNKEAPSVTQ